MPGNVINNADKNVQYPSNAKTFKAAAFISMVYVKRVAVSFLMQLSHILLLHLQ